VIFLFCHETEDTPVEFLHAIIDKQTFYSKENLIVCISKLHRNSHHLAEIYEVNKPDFATNIMLFRN